MIKLITNILILNGSLWGKKQNNFIKIDKITYKILDNFITNINFKDFIKYRIKNNIISSFSNNYSLLSNDYNKTPNNSKILQPISWKSSKTYNQTFYYNKYDFFSIDNHLNGKNLMDEKKKKYNQFSTNFFNEINFNILTNLLEKQPSANKIIDLRFIWGFSLFFKGLFTYDKENKTSTSSSLVYILNIITFLREIINYFFNKLFNWMNLDFFNYSKNSVFSLDIGFIIQYMNINSQDSFNYNGVPYTFKLHNTQLFSGGVSINFNLFNELVYYKNLGSHIKNMEDYMKTNDYFFQNLYKKSNQYTCFFKVKLNIFFNTNNKTKFYIEIIFFFWNPKDALMNSFLNHIYKAKFKNSINILKTANFINILI